MWLMLWPVIFWAVALVLTGALSYIRCKLEMLRTECLLSVIFALLNSIMIVLLGYQWVSYELDFDKLNRQHPHIINVQCIVSHALFFSFIGMSIIGCGSYLFAKKTPSNRNRHVDNSSIQLLFCAFAVGGAWMITYPSSQAKENQADFRDLLETGKYKELEDSLRGLANLHIGLMIFAWLLFYVGLYGFARGFYTLQSRVWDSLYRPSRFQRRMSAPVYSPYLPPGSEYGDLGAEFFGNRALVELKAFDQHPMVRPDADSTRPASRRHLASVGAVSDLTLPPPVFLSEERLSPSLVSIDTFNVEAPQSSPCSSIYRA
ncbi:hypothetical protein EMCG_07029 [[Emmonsia] crescens]|uniref:Uncharacterized protein n=1 Tax=[Emmonsia] crescens TaxID=73230 RepID=A0A0G2I9R8_9EURO|nr:hypothetical protein EMCG_07029 [Emmonsia crescens UAMH 3008]